jgi:hypothetical protein
MIGVSTYEWNCEMVSKVGLGRSFSRYRSPRRDLRASVAWEAPLLEGYPRASDRMLTERVSEISKPAYNGRPVLLRCL